MDELIKIDMELRELHKKIKNGDIDDIDKVKSRIEELRDMKTKLLKQNATPPAGTNGDGGQTICHRDIVNAMMEKRAITVNGAGAVGLVQEMFKQILEQNPIKGFSTFYGPNASTIIPVFSPLPARPVAVAEGETNISADTTGVFGGKSLLPKVYVSLLPVSAEALTFTGNTLEANLPSVFADVFADAIYQGMIAGTGTGEMKGIFKQTNLEKVEYTTSYGFKDFAKLALKAKAKGPGFVIVASAEAIIALLDESSKDPHKTEYLMNGTILGVPVVITSYAPLSNAPVAVALQPKNYGVAIASQIDIKPKTKVGDTNTYFEATMFFNGDVIVPKNAFALVSA